MKTISSKLLDIGNVCSDVEDYYVTLVDTTGGSGDNPVNDNTYTTSNFLVADLDASDRITNIKITNQVRV